MPAEEKNKSERTVFVVGFCPGTHLDGGVGGFEWRETPREAIEALTELLGGDATLESDYIIRRIRVPTGVTDVETWLINQAYNLWTTKAQGSDPTPGLKTGAGIGG